MSEKFDVIIIGAGAAGLMCAIKAGQRNKKVCLIEHSNNIGEKIRISGGGKCNFTNLNIKTDNFISNNPNFCISALKQFTQHDFINLVKKNKIKFHEKKMGQLFCDNSSKDIVNMLIVECERNNVLIKKNINIKSVDKNKNEFKCESENYNFTSNSLVISTGGLSIPKIGASSFGYDTANKFNLKIIKTKPALVPLTFDGEILKMCRKLSGVSISAIVNIGKVSFWDGILFTHRGISGPSILQISSYWNFNDKINVNFLSDFDIVDFLKLKRKANSKCKLKFVMSEIFPKSLVSEMILNNKKLAEISNREFFNIEKKLKNWSVFPTGTLGYDKAEVTIGGVDTNEISSKTMESKKIKGLYFIGEVLDVTGHLGGYNFQWAWSSGYVAGQNV